MFDFLIALFGGSYYAGKYAKEKADKRSYEAEQMARRAFYEKIGAPYELEREIDAMLADISRLEKVYEILHEDLLAVFGEDYRDKFLIPSIKGYYKKPGIKDHAYWGKVLLCSKQGKIPFKVRISGVPIGGIDDYDFCIEMAKRIEKNLQAFYPELRLVQVPDMRFDAKKNVTYDWMVYGTDLKIEQLISSRTQRRYLW